MANSDKNLTIRPRINEIANPVIEFVGADAGTGPQTITAEVTPADQGTVTFAGTSGTILTLADNATYKLDVNGDTRIDGDFTVTGSTTISGSTTFDTDIVPNTDNTGNVGTAALTWNDGHFTNFTVDSTLTTANLSIGSDTIAEYIADTVGAMVTSNTESGISVTYQDTDNTLDFDVDDFSITLTGDVTGTGTVTNLGNVSFSTTITANSVALGTDTTGNYVASLVAGALIDLQNNTGEGATPTIDVDLSELIDMTDTAVGTDELVILDTGLQRRKAINEIQLGLFDTANQIALGTDTTGNYVSTIAGTNNQVTVTGSGSETAAVTLSLPQNIHTGASPTFAGLTIGTDTIAEYIADTVGAMVTSNTESGISVTYQDTDNTLDFDVDDFTITLSGAVTGSGTVTNLGNVSITTTHTADPTITLTGAVTGSGTMTNLGNVSITTTNTADPTLTLDGDVSGSATFTNLGNATLTVTIADDSHNHIISNVDGLQTALNSKLDLAGGTMTGFVTLHADPTNALHAATKEYVDTIASASLHYHDPVRVETPGALSATYDNGTAGVGATLTNSGTQAALIIDGITMSVSDRVLVYNQANAAHNGVYTVTNVGSGSTNWILTRATDSDSYAASDPDALGTGDAYYVKEGNTGAGELYVMTTEGTITFGTTDITFSQISSAAIYSAGAGLDLTGTVFSHTDTSSQASVNNSGNTFIQDITLDTYGHVTAITSTAASIALGTETTGNYVQQGNTSGNGISGSVNSEGGTFTVTSNATALNTASTTVFRDASGNFSAGTITAALSGNATTATSWETSRTLELTGDVTGSITGVDGSGNISVATTITANSVALGTDTTGNYMTNVQGTTNEIEVTHTQDEGSTATIGLPNSVTISGTLTSADASFTGTSSLTVPNGTDAQRPGSPASGMFRFNTTSTEFEGYDGSAWGAIGGGATITNETTNATRYVSFVDSTSGDANSLYVSSTKLYFNPSTGQLNATEFNSLSDITYKENIKPINDSLELLKKITPYSFNWKEDGRASYGVIAQEIEKILPELVSENEQGVKSVSYIPLIALLIDAIKTLSDK